jgi:tetratricopeptide (TPR) repeat protein
LEERAGRLAEALDLLVAGLEKTPQDPELHYRIALVMAEVQGERANEIRSHFQAALLGPVRNYRPRLSYGAYLFSLGQYENAKEQFDRLESLEVSNRERFEARSFNFGSLGEPQAGRISRRSSTFAIIEIDRGATTVFMSLWGMAEEQKGGLSAGRAVRFRLAFNLKGALAVDVQVE